MNLNFIKRLFVERNVYGALSFAETAESLVLTRKALAIKPGDCVVGAISSGDILLSSAAQGAGTIIGFDMNPMQKALADLKLAAIQNLTVEDYLAFFGIVPIDPQKRVTMFNKICNCMPNQSKQLFLRRQDIIRAGLLNCGMTYLIVRIITIIFKLIMNKDNSQLFLGCCGTKSDRQEKLNSFVERVSVRLFLNPFLRLMAPILKWFFFPRLICQVSSRPTEMIANFFQTFAPLFENGILSNPVLCRAALNNLHSEWTEELYNEQSFNIIRENQKNISFKTASIFQALSDLPDNVADKVYLSNIPDYLTNKELIELSNELRRVTKPNARILYLSLSDVDRFDDSFGPLLEEVELKAIRQLDNVYIYPLIVVRTRGDVV